MIFLLPLLFLAACTGPQLISSPTPEATPVLKKAQIVENKSDEVIDSSDDQGVFDDENFQLKTDTKLWKLIDDDDSIQTYEKVQSNKGLVAFRGEILIPAPLKKVATILVDDSLQKEWVDSFVETKNLKTISELEHVEYNQTKVPWPFQNRDFVFMVKAKVNVNPATMLITMKSIEDPSMPPREGTVRGDIVHSYYYLKELNGLRATKMVVEMEVDPKGAIPMWLVNLSQKGWPHNTLAAVKKLAMKDDIQVMPKLENYFNPVKKTKKGKTK